ncbi:MAG: cysteine--tRNA ligase, partial [Thermoleophilia bacterium]|nr:cysteine--tRNA ligase [Thermoleophilia bacterium]
AEFWLHGGGLDLVFPHHENERAQSLAAGRGFARIWMHNGMLRFTGEKMSKSVGNVATIQEVLGDWGAETALLFFMTAHWRKPIDFSEETMAAARAQAETFRNFFREARDEDGAPPAREELAEALDDDFNTPDALALFHEWRGRGDATSLRWGLGLFGLAGLAVDSAAPTGLVDLAERRAAAREARDWDEADRLRDEIAAAGWEVRDIEGSPPYRLVRRL